MTAAFSDLGEEWCLVKLHRIRNLGLARVVAKGVRRYNGVSLNPSRVLTRPHFSIRVNGRLAGWIGYERRQPHVYEIAHLSVLPGFRRRGFAESAVKRVLVRVRSAGGRLAYARIKRGNYASQSLFRKCSFRKVTRRERIYRFARKL